MAAAMINLDAAVSIEIEDRELLDFTPDLSDHITSTFVSTKIALQKLLHSQERVDWIIAHDGGEHGTRWTETQASQCQQLVITAQKYHQLQALIILECINPTDNREDDYYPWIEREMQWQKLTVKMQATEYGSPIMSTHRLIIATSDVRVLETLQIDKMTPDCIRPYLVDRNQSAKVIPFNTFRAIQRPTTQPYDASATEARKTMLVKRPIDPTTSPRQPKWLPVYDIDHPAPSLLQHENKFHDHPFAIDLSEGLHVSHRGIGGIRTDEVLAMYGFDEQQTNRMLTMNDGDILDHVATSPPAALLATIMQGLLAAERRTPSPYIAPLELEKEETDGSLYEYLITMQATEIQAVTSLPLPSTLDWQQATEQDPDLALPYFTVSLDHIMFTRSRSVIRKFLKWSTLSYTFRKPT